MAQPRFIKAFEARLIECENGLTPGAIAADRPATEAEIIYLDKAPECTQTTFHIISMTCQPALVLIDHPPEFLDAIHAAKMNWGLLVFGRHRGMKRGQGDPVALDLACVSEVGDKSHHFSISVHLSEISNIFHNASRKLTLAPIFTSIPPTEYEDFSPGMCIQSLGVTRIIRAESISLYSSYKGRKYSALEFPEFLKEYTWL